MFNRRKIQKSQWGSTDLQVPPQPNDSFLKLKVQLYQVETFQGSVCVMTNTPRRTHHLTPTPYAIAAKKKGFSQRVFQNIWIRHLSWTALSAPFLQHCLQPAETHLPPASAHSQTDQRARMSKNDAADAKSFILEKVLDNPTQLLPEYLHKKSWQRFLQCCKLGERLF